MPIYFFDTSALKHRYTPGSPHGRRIKRLISDRRSTCYIADWTVHELASAFGSHCRGNHWDVANFDRMDKLFFDDLGTGRIRVRNNNSREILSARTLLRKAVMINRDVDSGDALIASCCRDLAFELNQRITFYTADWGFYTLLRSMDSYRVAMKLRFVGVPKNGIPAET